MSDQYNHIPSNLLLSITGGSFAFFAGDNFNSSIVLTIVLFAIGKVIDVFVKIYLEKKKSAREN